VGGSLDEAKSQQGKFTVAENKLKPNVSGGGKLH